PQSETEFALMCLATEDNSVRLEKAKDRVFTGQPNPVFAGQQNPVSAGQPNPVSTGEATLACNSIPLSDNSFRLEKAKDRGIVDSGCSRSMSGKKDKLDDFEDFDGGEVTFGGSTGKISGKGAIKTKTLNFENVLYVEELQHFNLISVS
nr:ribonuclease H-like domain-containing protein [Tanacetum cinerariifolium]